MSLKKSKLNKFFDKIFVISLFDKVERWQKVSKQFKNRKIDVERFIAIDGRCSNESNEACMQKLKSFEMIFNVKITNKKNKPIKELIPAASLSIGTILILREMVKQKWNHILICEDDINITRNFEEKFSKGIKEIGNAKWDVLYLGCGEMCGNNGISDKKTKTNKHLCPMSEYYEDYKFYCESKDDLRIPCDNCKFFSENISIVKKIGGGWAYAVSLSGAKKILKLIDNDAGNHMDQIIPLYINEGKLKGLSFDPPIIYHEGGIVRTDSDIPW